MKPLFPRLQRVLALYLSLAMLLGAEPAAQAFIQAGACALDAVAHSMPRAFADGNQDGTNHATWAHSKPAIWVNYADPRPKGDDADKGSAPGYYPEVSINNVSLMPSVQLPLLNAVTPAGVLNLSLSLSYSPPVISRSGFSDTVSASPSPFGHCWSDSLLPMIEENLAPNGYILERTLRVNGANLPSLSFKCRNNIWHVDPLSKGSYDAGGVSFWQSGVRMPSQGPTNVMSRGMEWSIYTCPVRVFDRNTNNLHFSYNGWQTTRITPGQSVLVPIPVCASNDLGERLLFQTETRALPYRVLAGWFTNYLAVVTKIIHAGVAGATRTVALDYTSFEDLHYLMLSSVVYPDNSTTRVTYSSISIGTNQTIVPVLDSVITMQDTITLDYGSWAFYDAMALTYKCEPTRVTVIRNDGQSRETYVHGTIANGSVSMTTISDAGCTNVKSYALRYLPLNMQWYGCETENTLDGVKQNSYGHNNRFLHNAVTRYPAGDTGPSDISGFTYDDRDNLTSVTDAYGNITRYFYAPNKLDQTCVIDPRGVVSSNIFDPAGNLLISIADWGSGKLNRMSSNVYNRAGQIIKAFDALNRCTRNFYSTNRLAQPISSYDTEEPTITDIGFLIATRDAENRVSTFSYDAFGRQCVANTPGSGTTGARYAVTNTFDIMDRQVTTLFPDGTYISNVYNTAGYPVRVRDRANRWTVNTYDAAGHLVHVLYPNGDWVKKEYSGNLVSKLMDAAGNTTEYFYCHEQLTGVRFPDGSTRAAGFDNLNRQIWAVDERGVAVTNAYDKLDRLIASAYVPFTGEAAMPADVTSVPATLTPSTCNWSLIYGGFADQHLTNSYDCVGNLLGTRDWVGTINHSYDALNRRLSEAVEYSISPYLEYSLALSYDAADNVVTQDFDSDDLVVQTTYSYDGLNRLKTLNASPDGLPVSATYRYLDNGKLQLKRYVESGSEKAHQVYSYDSENRLSAVSYGTLCSVTYGYNFAQQISSMNETIAGTERRFVYEYDQRDQLTEETEWLYAGDELDWLEGPPNMYTYDHAQNRATAVKSGQSIYETYGYSIANKMTNIWRGSASASSRYWYDLAGNLSTSIVGYATNCYHYNVQNRLVKIVGTNFVHEFKYNSRNERIAVGISVNGATMTWRYDACQGPVTLAEFNSSLYMTRWYVRGLGVAQGIGDVVAEVDVTGATAKPHYYLSNHRGDTLVVLNPDGADNSTFRYDAFGKCYAATGPFTPRYTFSTKEFLPQAQLYLYQHRLYDVAAGRWTQRDSIDYQDSLNLYCFCGNNPMNSVDALGQEAKWTIAPTFQKAFDRVVGTKRGAAIRRDLNKKFDSIQILASDKDNPAGVNKSADGKTLTIYIDPTAEIMYQLETPRDFNSESDASLMARASLERLIAHELGHHSDPRYDGREYLNINENENPVTRELNGSSINDRNPNSHDAKPQYPQHTARQAQ
jgi:RHS repeat-associated protein